jgi:hypothetical protein
MTPAHIWQDCNNTGWIYRCPVCGWYKLTQPDFYKDKPLPTLYTQLIDSVRTQIEPECIMVKL